MGKIKYHITLSDMERGMLKRIIRGSRSEAQKTKRAKILLLWSQDHYTVHEIAKRANCCPATVSNIKKRYDDLGFKEALKGGSKVRKAANE